MDGECEENLLNHFHLQQPAIGCDFSIQTWTDSSRSMKFPSFPPRDWLWRMIVPKPQSPLFFVKKSGWVHRYFRFQMKQIWNQVWFRPGTSSQKAGNGRQIANARSLGIHYFRRRRSDCGVLTSTKEADFQFFWICA
jgi:hypothetical protein